MLLGPNSISTCGDKISTYQRRLRRFRILSSATLSELFSAQLRDKPQEFQPTNRLVYYGIQNVVAVQFDQEYFATFLAFT
jgi:hypothetical protein